MDTWGILYFCLILSKEIFSENKWFNVVSLFIVQIWHNSSVIYGSNIFFSMGLYIGGSKSECDHLNCVQNSRECFTPGFDVYLSIRDIQFVDIFRSFKQCMWWCETATSTFWKHWTLGRESPQCWGCQPDWVWISIFLLSEEKDIVKNIGINWKRY